MTTSIVRVENVSKRFVMHKHKSLKERLVNFTAARRHREDFWALKDIDLDIGLGSTVGLVGHNGSGKSTLLKVIGGIISPTEGAVLRRGRMAALLELGAGFHPDLTGRENVYLNGAVLGLTTREIDRYFDAIVDFSGIEDFIDTQVKFYSSGMYVRLAFAVAVHVDPDLLLVDEVLAVGDEPFQRKCMEKISSFQQEGRTIIVVSHSASQIGRLCDRVVVMDHGEMVFDGPPVDGLRVLRFGYDEQRRHEENRRGERVLPPGAHIASISPVDAAGAPLTEVQSGDDLRIAFRFEVTEPQPDLVAGIAIETSQGEPLYGVNTRVLELPLRGAVGAHTVHFDLARQALGAGPHIVRGSLETVGGDSLDRLNPGATFSVVNPPPGSGYVRMEAAVSVS